MINNKNNRASAAMSTMTLNLDKRHMAALGTLAVEQDMSKTAVLRQALRLYQMVHQRAKDGQQLAFVDRQGKLVRQVVVGLPAFDDDMPAGMSADGKTDRTALSAVPPIKETK